ncbi:MAG: carbohydrate ABC transporter substrate-binding protein, partial [Oscillospiraceae bacterium]|nr:carbohydrate ABC transporter substrate-binding protein [Oscillospiraceae bacterium]
MKKLLALLLALAMSLSLVACGGNDAPADEPADDAPAAEDSAADEPAEDAPAEDAAASGKTVINLWSFTDEVPGMVNKYLELHPEFAEKYEIKTTIIATTEGAYQPALDQALAGGGEDAPDIYCAEAAFVLKYTQGDASGYAASYDDLGIDTAAAIEAADIAQYSVDIGTNPEGSVVALGYQATGGAFIYRRSIAIDTWGTDDPAVIAEKIGAGTGSWDKFYDAAAELKAKGYGI